MSEHIHIEISTSSIIKMLLAVIALVAFYLLKDVLIIFLYALVIASAVSPFVNWLEKKRLPRLLAVLLLYIVVFGLIVLITSLVVPSISQDLSQLTSAFPRIVEKLSSSLNTVQQGVPRYFDFLSEIQNVLDVLTSYLQQVSQSAIGLVIGIFGGAFSFMAIIIISFYLSYMRRGIEAFLASVIPHEYKSYTIGLWKRSEAKVGRWLQGQLLLALMMGLVVYVGLSLMGVRFALISGLLIMVLEIVPVVGPVLAALPAIGFAFLQGSTLGLWVIVFYIVIQQLESNVLVPIVLGKSTGLNPVVVILALLVGSKLAGISGAILAIPVASIVVEILDDLAEHTENGASS